MGATERLLRFGVYELNLDAEELRKDGIPIKLPPQPIKVLSLLASRAGQVVTREEIQQDVWGEGTYVDFEHGLNQCIKQIRTALNDNADRPVYVETIPRRGYRFLAPVVSKTVAIAPPKVTESPSGMQSRVQLPLVTADVTTVPGLDVGPQRDNPSPNEVVSAPPGSKVELPVQTAPSSPVRDRSAVLRYASFVLVIAVIAGGYLYWHAQKARALTDKDTVVLADFDNSTGEPVLDTALKTALTTDLDQSPFLNVLSAQSVREQMGYMNQPNSAPLTPDLARQLCLRSGSKAILVASVARLGAHYPLALRAENCKTGDVLGEVQGEATSREQLLAVLHKNASSLRRQLGESLASVQKYDINIEKASTPSLEALQAYSLGLKAQETEGESASIPYYKRAIELDPSFAMAYARIGVAYANLTQQNLAITNISKAHDLREHTSEREKLYITAHYYDIRGDLNNAIATYTLFRQIYPRQPAPYENLSVIYIYIGAYDRCLSEADTALMLNPADATIYANSSFCQISLNQLNDAGKTLNAAAARKINHEYLVFNHYWLAFLTNDQAGMTRELESALGVSGVEDQMFAIQSDTEAFAGRIAKARAYTQRACDSARHGGLKEPQAIWKLDGALHEAEFGNFSQAMRDARDAMGLSRSKGIDVLAALALARSGDPQPAKKIADQLEQEYPSDTLIQSYWLPTIRASILLDQNNPQGAITLLQTAIPYELGAPTPGIGFMYPVYIRGLAYLKAADGARAEAEFAKMLAHPGIVQNFPLGALAQLQIGRAQFMRGDLTAARRSYEKFFNIWNDADKDVVLLSNARTEYSNLK